MERIDRVPTDLLSGTGVRRGYATNALGRRVAGVEPARAGDFTGASNRSAIDQAAACVVRATSRAADLGGRDRRGGAASVTHVPSDSRRPACRGEGRDVMPLGAWLVLRLS